jgi:hypothetical protein
LRQAPQQKRFAAYLDRLAHAAEHLPVPNLQIKITRPLQGGAVPLKSYCTGFE